MRRRGAHLDACNPRRDRASAHRTVVNPWCDETTNMDQIETRPIGSRSGDAGGDRLDGGVRVPARHAS